MDEQVKGNFFTKKKIIIILAIIILAGLIYWLDQLGAFSEKKFALRVQSALESLQPNPEKMPAITADDHILGDTKAPVKLVVYTDLECPYCKVFHNSLNELKADYIKDGKVAIIYRNLPLDQLHQKARPEAIASECVAKLGDNDKFWQFVDKIFETTTSNDGLDLALLPTFAKELGIDEGAFNNCLEDSEVQEALEKVAEGASLAGAQGTPYPIVVKGDKVLGSLPGALPADDLRKVVDQVTAEK